MSLNEEDKKLLNNWKQITSCSKWKYMYFDINKKENKAKRRRLHIIPLDPKIKFDSDIEERPMIPSIYPKNWISDSDEDELPPLIDIYNIQTGFLNHNKHKIDYKDVKIITKK